MSQQTWTTADWIRRELEERGWGPKRLSVESGIDQRAIFKYLRGESEPSARNLAKIVSAFGYDAFWTSNTCLRHSLSDLLGRSRHPVAV